MMKIWQIYFDKTSKKHLDKDFISYDNTSKKTNIYENAVILDIWENKREEWIDADYVGVLSWRFKEKTNLSYKKIKEQVKGKDIYLLTPPSYMTFSSPFSERAFESVSEVARVADSEKILPFELYNYDLKNGNKECVSFCNYFLVKPYVFDDYCSNVLKPMAEWVESGSNADLLKYLAYPFYHRDKKQYPVQTFFLEGLFQCYVHHSKIPYEYIFDKNMLMKKERLKEEKAEKEKLLEFIFS